MHLLEVKGNLVVNPVLGMKVMVPHQCVKIRSLGRPDDVEHGLVVARTSTRQMKKPGAMYGHVYVLTTFQVHVSKRWIEQVAGLSYFLLAVLKLRVAFLIGNLASLCN